MAKTKQPEALLSQRAALILLLALIVGVVAGLVSYWATPSAPASILVGGGAFGGAIALLDQLIA